MSTFSQRSFAGGEIAPALYARVDTTKYQTGLRTLRNFILMRHGGAQTRPGTKFIGEVKDSTKVVRLIKFVFNTAQTYVLEFGDQYMRVIRDGSYQYDLTLTITGITNANPAVVTYTGTDPSNGQEVYISGITGAIGTYLNGRNFKIANVNGGANTFELQYMSGSNVNSTGFGSYTSGGTAQRVYTLSTPYLEANLMQLQYVQSADVMTIVHPDYAPRELTRSGHTSWSLSTITFAPSQAAPTSPTNGGAGGATYSWVITAIADETYEESLQSTATTSSTDPSVTPVTISWTGASGAIEYNVYRALNGVYGFIGTASGTSFQDTGYDPDTSDTPPVARNPFNASGDYPSAVTYIQQRLTFGNTDNDPEKVWASKSGLFHNFTTSSPLQEDDAVTFSLAGRQVNEIKHLLDLGRLVTLTSGGEWAVEGDAGGVLTPTQINPKQYSYNGSADLAPIVVGSNALYVQARGSIVRDLSFDYQVDGYRGTDLTIFSAHLFDGYTLSDWDYQQIPHSVVWAARSDGTLLGLTYVREHQLVGWHRHDFTDATVENVCVIPEGNEDVLYLVLSRTVDGRTVRYVERMDTRSVSDIVDFIGLDTSLSYDGRNTGSTTMTLTGSGWTYTDTLTLTASASYFTSADVGNAIHITGTDGTEVRCTITAYTNATVVSVTPHMTVPVAMRAVAFTTWARAVDQLTGLWHLEGKEVSVFADGFVVASPNNESYTTVTVTNGTITLDKTYTVIHVGLPFVADIYTLDIDTAQGETIVDKKKLISAVTVYFETSRGLWVGATPPTDDTTDPLEGLTELKIRSDESYDSPVDLLTGNETINIRPEWNSNGRIFLRQVDPLPLAILAVAPAGLMPFRGA